MSLSTYEKGDTITIPATFTDLNTGAEASSVPDASIQIFFGNTQIVGPTPMINISGGKYFFSYAIPGSAQSGVYSVYVSGTVNASLQVATLKFSVTDRLTNLQNTANAIQLDIQGAKIDIENKVQDLQDDIGDPTSDGTTIHQELQDIKSDIGDPILTGQNITQKLDDIRTVLGLGVPVGIVAVSGSVTNDNNVALPNVRVVAVDTSTGMATDVAQTGNTGAYTLNLDPGTYIFQFLQAQTILRQTITVTVPTLVTTLTVPTVILTTKRTVTDVVQDPNQQPIEGVLVKAIFEANYDANAAQNQVEAAAFTDVDGEFTLELFPGLYIFEFIKAGFSTLPQKITVF